MTLNALHRLLSESKWEKAKALVELEEAKELLKERDDDGNLPLHISLIMTHGEGWTSFSQRCEVVKCLVEKYPEGVHLRNKEKQLPIHLAEASSEIVDSCWALTVLTTLAKSWPKSLKEPDSNGRTPFQFFAKFCKTSLQFSEILELCPEAAKVKNKVGGQLPMHVAATYDNAAGIKALSEAWPESLRERDWDGNLPFHLLRGNRGCCEKVIALYPEGLRIRNKRGLLPIGEAASNQEGNTMISLANAYPKGLFPIPSFDPITELVRERIPKYMFTELEKLLSIREEARNHQLRDFLKATKKKVKDLEESLDSLKAMEKKNKHLEESNASLRTENQDMLDRSLAARKGEQALLEGFLFKDPALISSIMSSETLKSIAESMDTRLSAVKSKLARKPSLSQKTLPSLLRDEQVDKEVLIEVIEALNAELLALDDNCETEANKAAAAPAEEGEDTVFVATFPRADDTGGVASATSADIVYELNMQGESFSYGIG
jgi:hypothetical protein